MIYIKETDLQSTNNVSALDRIIAVEHDNDFLERIFVLPTSYYGADLSDSNFSFILQVEPDIKDIPPYMNVLDKEIIDDKVYLTWHIKRHDTAQSCTLKANILINHANKDLVKQTFPVEFLVVNGIDAIDYLSELPPTILEQYLAEISALYSEFRQKLDVFDSIIVTGGAGDKVLYDDGTYKKIIGGTGGGHTIVKQDDEEMPQRSKLKFNGALISDDETNDITEVIITGGSGGGSGTTDDVLVAEDIKILGTSIGALNDGQTIRAGESLTNLLKSMSQKVIPPTYIQPTLSLTGSAPTSVEIGSNITPVISASFSKNHAGNLTNYTLRKNGVSVFSGATIQTFTDTAFQITENIDYSATANYESGVVLNDNLGNPSLSGQILAGSKTSNTVNYSVYRNAFYQAFSGDTVIPTTSNDIRALSGKLNNPSNGSTINLAIPAGTTKIVVTYPNALRDLTSVLSAALSMNIKDVFNLSTITVTGANNFGGISYKVYTYVPVIPYGSSDNLTITI